jgi:NitT/TauT family transport system substrate-binding protein
MSVLRVLISAIAIIVCSAAAAMAEVSELRIPLGAGGFGFLPLHMMQKYKLIERYAEEAGLKITVSWPNIGGAAVMNDALLSGSADFISAGPPSFLTLWDRTHSNLAVKSIAAISSIPVYLNARVADLKSLDDIQEGQKITLVGIKVAIPAIIMQMYAQKKYGNAEVFRFDPYTVNMNHADALIALTSGSRSIAAHWASAPFYQRELKDPAIHTIMNSDEIMGGSTTFTMISTTTKFWTQNPKICAAVLKALKRAEEMIGEDKHNAAQVLLEAMGGGKGWSVDEFVAILNDPATKYTTRPENVLKYANFMHEIGSIRNKPNLLSHLFFDSKEVDGGN